MTKKTFSPSLHNLRVTKSVNYANESEKAVQI